MDALEPGSARRQGAHQDGAAEAVGRGTRAAKADREEFMRAGHSSADSGDDTPRESWDRRRIRREASRRTEGSACLTRPTALPAHLPDLHAVPVARFVRRADGGRRVERVDRRPSRRLLGADEATTARMSLSVSDLAIVGDRHQRAVDLDQALPLRARSRGRRSASARRAGPSACRAPAGSTARRRPRRA